MKGYNQQCDNPQHGKQNLETREAGHGFAKQRESHRIVQWVGGGTQNVAPNLRSHPGFAKIANPKSMLAIMALLVGTPPPAFEKTTCGRWMVYKNNNKSRYLKGYIQQGDDPRYAPPDPEAK